MISSRHITSRVGLLPVLEQMRIAFRNRLIILEEREEPQHGFLAFEVKKGYYILKNYFDSQPQYDTMGVVDVWHNKDGDAVVALYEKEMIMHTLTVDDLFFNQYLLESKYYLTPLIDPEIRAVAWDSRVQRMIYRTPNVSGFTRYFMTLPEYVHIEMDYYHHFYLTTDPKSCDPDIEIAKSDVSEHLMQVRYNNYMDLWFRLQIEKSELWRTSGERDTQPMAKS